MKVTLGYVQESSWVVFHYDSYDSSLIKGS